MKKVTSKKVIPVDCSALGPNLNTYLKSKLDECIGKCTQEYGYIMEVGKFKIVDTEISRATSETNMSVLVEFSTIKPEIGMTLRATISMCVAGQGMYVYSNGKIKILIPERTLKNFKFENSTYKSTDKVLSIGDEIDVTITNIKFDKNNFQCIGVV